jgi:hypothetical protein
LSTKTALLVDPTSSKLQWKKKWIEGQTRTIKLLEETCTQTFVHYLNFAYLEKLPTQDMKKATSDDGAHYTGLAKIYVLGERMLNKPVQHAVIREIRRLAKFTASDGKLWLPGFRSIAIVYEGTSAGCPMRQLLVDMHLTHGVTICNGPEHPEFLIDFSKALLKNVLAQKTACDFRSRKLVAEDYIG